MRQPTTAHLNLRKEKIKHKLTLLAILLSYAPFLLLADLPDNTTSSIIGYLARQTGYLAATFLLWQFILGTRALTKFWITDQVWALNIHKKIGLYGIVLVLAHPFLIAYDYGRNLDFIFIPDLTTEFGRHIALGRTAFFLFLFIWITSAVFRSNIGYRPWKYIHYLTYPIMLMVFLHAPEIGSFYAGDTIIQAVWTAMIALFGVIVLIRIGSIFTFGQRPYKLTAKKEIAEDVFVYTLQPEGKKIVPKPGQFIYLRRELMSEEHPFTIARFNTDGVLQIAAKRFGKYTHKLAETPIGTVVYADGPYGVFTREVTVDLMQPTTFIAGGIGITPFLQHIFTEKSDNIYLFYANKSHKNILQGPQLQRILGDRYVNILQDNNNKLDGSKQGYITIDMLQETLGNSLEDQQFYICGPPAMMQSVKKILLDAGIDRKRIHTEEFGY